MRISDWSSDVCSSDLRLRAGRQRAGDRDGSDGAGEVTERIAITEQSVPGLPAGVKLRFDKQRDQWVILAPERLFVLDAIALEIVKRCDGAASVGAIVDDLAEIGRAHV